MKKISDLSRVPNNFSAFTVTHPKTFMLVFRNNKKHDDVRPFANETGYFLFPSLGDINSVLSVYGYKNSGELPNG
jgi:hypothetical protein